MSMRLFLALWPEATLQEAMGRFASEIVRAAGGRATAVPKIHLTLAFLGNVEPDVCRCVEAAVATVEARAFTLKLDRIGSFRTGVVWLGASAPSAPLSELQAVVAERLGRCGIALEVRPFVPHVTLVRKCRERVSRALAPIEWRVERFRLVASERGPEGSRYRCLSEYPLLTPALPVGAGR